MPSLSGVLRVSKVHIFSDLDLVVPLRERLCDVLLIYVTAGHFCDALKVD